MELVVGEGLIASLRLGETAGAFVFGRFDSTGAICIRIFTLRPVGVSSVFVHQVFLDSNCNVPKKEVRRNCAPLSRIDCLTVIFKRFRKSKKTYVVATYSIDPIFYLAASLRPFFVNSL